MRKTLTLSNQDWSCAKFRKNCLCSIQFLAPKLLVNLIPVECFLLLKNRGSEGSYVIYSFVLVSFSCYEIKSDYNYISQKCHKRKYSCVTDLIFCLLYFGIESLALRFQWCNFFCNATNRPLLILGSREK